MSFKWTLSRGKRVLYLEGTDLSQAVSTQLGCCDDINFELNIGVLLSLSIPEPTDCYQDWIHTEQGPQGTYIVRLVRFYRAARVEPWQSEELYVAEGNQQTVARDRLWQSVAVQPYDMASNRPSQLPMGFLSAVLETEALPVASPSA